MSACSVSSWPASENLHKSGKRAMSARILKREVWPFNLAKARACFSCFLILINEKMTSLMLLLQTPARKIPVQSISVGGNYEDRFAITARRDE
jgi:hypothetical protein